MLPSYGSLLSRRTRSDLTCASRGNTPTSSRRNLVEAELFDYMWGAFTGATENKL